MLRLHQDFLQLTPNFLLWANLAVLNGNCTARPTILQRACEHPRSSQVFLSQSDFSLQGMAAGVCRWALELWALGLFYMPVCVSSARSSCTLQTTPVSGSLYQEGDVIVGGLFPVYVSAPEPDHTFTRRVDGGRCQR